MKIRSAVLALTDEEINNILASLDLPVTRVTVKSTMGRLMVKIRKGLTKTVWITFAADGRHLTATVDAGALVNPFVGGILSRLTETAGEWGVSRCGKTVIFDPEEALRKAGMSGDVSVVETAVGAGELVFALEADLPLDQLINKKE